MKLGWLSAIIVATAAMAAGFSTGSSALAAFTALVLVVPAYMAQSKAHSPAVFAVVLLMAVAMAPGAAATPLTDTVIGGGLMKVSWVAKTWAYIAPVAAPVVGCIIGLPFGGPVGCTIGAASAVGGTQIIDTALTFIPGGKQPRDLTYVQLFRAAGDGDWNRVGQTAVGTLSPSGLAWGDRVRDGQDTRVSDVLWTVADGLPGSFKALKALKGVDAAGDAAKALQALRGADAGVEAGVFARHGIGAADEGLKVVAPKLTDISKVRAPAFSTSRAASADLAKAATTKISGAGGAVSRTVGRLPGAGLVTGRGPLGAVTKFGGTLADDAAKLAGRMPGLGRVTEGSLRGLLTVGRAPMFAKAALAGASSTWDGVLDGAPVGDDVGPIDPNGVCAAFLLKHPGWGERACNEEFTKYLDCVKQTGFWGGQCLNLVPSALCDVIPDACVKPSVAPGTPGGQGATPADKYAWCTATLSLPQKYCESFATEAGALESLFNWFMDNLQPVVAFDGKPVRYEGDGGNLYEVEFEVNHGVFGFECKDPLLGQLAKALGSCYNRYGLDGLDLAATVDGKVVINEQVTREEMLAGKWLDGKENVAMTMWIPVEFSDKKSTIKVAVVPLYHIYSKGADGKETALPPEGSDPESFSEGSGTKTYEVQPCEDAASCKDKSAPGSTGVGGSNGAECNTGENCLANAGKAVGGTGMEYFGKYWWVFLLLIVGGGAFIVVYRNGTLYMWTSKNGQGGIGKKPAGGPEVYQKPSIFAKVKAKVTGQEPPKALKPAFRLDGVPVNAPAKPDGSGPDLKAFKKQLEDADD